MKKIGLIGGIGWPSTISYYQEICNAANKHFGDRTAPEILIYSMNMAPMEKLQYNNKWQTSAELLSEYAKILEQGGAECILICSGTTNVPSASVQENIQIPLINIVEPTAIQIKKSGLKKIGLLGTKVTMEHPFFRGELKKHNIEVIIPNPQERAEIQRIIYDELCYNIIKPEAKKRFLKIINNLIDQGAEGIVLGCTEIPMLVQKEDITIPSFDMAKLHALSAFEFAIS